MWQAVTYVAQNPTVQAATKKWLLVVLVMMFAPCACGLLLLSSPGALTSAANAASCTPSLPPGQATGGAWTGEQQMNAAAILAQGRLMGVPDRGLIVALATAMQESSLVNLDHGDAPGYVGLFQQYTTWGPLEVRLNPAGAAGLFFQRLLAVPGWQDMPVTEAAQRVQISAYPTAYARWEQPATQLASSLAGVTSTCGGATVGGYASPLPPGAIVPPVPEHHDYPAADIGASVGTQVYAVQAGQVRVFDEPGGCGAGVAVVSGEAEWIYCHASQRSVRSNDAVQAGQAIMLTGGATGSLGAGSSTGPHLHVQVRVAGTLRCVQPLLDALALGQSPPDVTGLSATYPCRG